MRRKKLTSDEAKREKRKARREAKRAEKREAMLEEAWDKSPVTISRKVVSPNGSHSEYLMVEHADWNWTRKYDLATQFDGPKHATQYCLDNPDVMTYTTRPTYGGGK